MMDGRGFRASAEQLAITIRSKLGLTPFERLDTQTLAAYLGILVVSLCELRNWGANETSIRHFVGEASGDFSTLTLRVGTAILLAFNPCHAAVHRPLVLTQAMSHVILRHRPGPLVGVGRCRRWTRADEGAASHLARALLIPEQAILRYTKLGTTSFSAATEMGVDVRLFDVRMGQAGICSSILCQDTTWPSATSIVGCSGYCLEDCAV